MALWSMSTPGYHHYSGTLGVVSIPNSIKSGLGQMRRKRKSPRRRLAGACVSEQVTWRFRRVDVLTLRQRARAAPISLYGLRCFPARGT